MAFPIKEFNAACNKHDYDTAIKIIEIHGVVVSSHRHVFEIMNIQNIQSKELFDVIFNNSGILDRINDTVKKLYNTSAAVKSLISLRDTHKNKDIIKKQLVDASYGCKNEECIMMLCEIGLLPGRYCINEVKSKANHIKIIKLLGYDEALKYEIFHPYLSEYCKMIDEEKWDCKLIDYADPCLNSYPTSTFKLAIDRGRHDYVKALIEFTSNRKRITKLTHQREVDKFGRTFDKRYDYNVLTYSITSNKYKCTEVLLQYLGDICQKIMHDNEQLDIFEYCMVVNDIRTLKLFIGTDHKTYSTGLNPIDIFRFIARFDSVRRHTLWTIIREKYIKDREACEEPLTEDEHFMDKQLTVISDDIADIKHIEQSRERRI